ncbi:MAG: FHA domain-containing protein [Candidatus Aminicenantes bacterium]|nr:FHA domain-containing protein [Candidatus Aminicenantes bacterium]
MKKTFILLGIIVLFCGMSFSQEKVKVNDIKNNFLDYKDEKVILEGFATQIVEDTSQTTDFYFLKDDWGGIIKIRTSQALPEIGKKYQVVGIADQDPATQDLFITEEVRLLLTPEAPTAEEKTGFSKWFSKNWPYLIGALAVVVVFLLVFVLIYALNQRKALTTTDLPATSVGTAPAGGAEPLPEPEKILEGTTVKMAIPPPGTLKLLPGKFVVKAGDEQIKEIRFYKEKGAPDTEITFGRAQETSYTHIELKPMTVSAKQAKLIYAGNKFTLINYSATNPTRINDKNMPENGSVEVKDKDKIEMGEMVFEFQLTK